MFTNKTLTLFKTYNSVLSRNMYKFSTVQTPHFNAKLQPQVEKSSKMHPMPHPVWPKETVHDCPITIKERRTVGDKFAYYLIQTLRTGFDVLSGYTPIFPWQSKEVSQRTWVNRLLFLESVAGVPGFVGAMIRHLRSLRKMRRDQGWIHTLLEEAENERVHLITFLNIKNPTKIFRAGVILGQVGFTAFFTGLYLLAPRTAHRAVGYLEEQAVITYTHLIEEINREGSPICQWKTELAPKLAVEYWQLGEGATIEDLMLAVRKDEEHHKEVNHNLADDYTQNKPNPFPPGY